MDFKLSSGISKVCSINNMSTNIYDNGTIVMYKKLEEDITQKVVDP